MFLHARSVIYEFLWRITQRTNGEILKIILHGRYSRTNKESFDPTPRNQSLFNLRTSWICLGYGGFSQEWNIQ